MHAYLIMAHKNGEQLKKLLKLLDYSENEIYIHIDKKAPLSMKSFDYAACCNWSQVKQYSVYNITWGSVSQIKCELFLMEMAANEREYQYYHLLSGLDLPLRTQEEIHAFFDQIDGKELIHYASCREKGGALADDRAKYYWATSWYNILPLKRSLSIMRRLDRLQVKVQKMAGINRLKRWGIQRLYRGANWFSISDQLVRSVLEEKEWILRVYAASNCCDEVFLQTFIKMHTGWEARLYHPAMDDNYMSIKRAIDWNRGGPYVWRNEDYNQLMDSSFLFARKFDETVDCEVIDRIYQAVMQKTKG